MKIEIKPEELASIMMLIEAARLSVKKYIKVDLDDIYIVDNVCITKKTMDSVLEFYKKIEPIS